MRSRWHIAGLVLSVYFHCSLVFAQDSWEKNCQRSGCYAIIDAGSSGSRFYIYSHNYQTLWSKKITPGLSQVSPREVSDYLQQLVPQSGIQGMPTYFYGTAGMRLLSESEQIERYEAAKQWFSQNAAWDIKDIRTLLGKEEGFFAWMAANQNEGDLQGVMEIGGASYQINIPVSQEIAMRLPPEDITSFSKQGHLVHVWTKSYLGLGINEVEKKVAVEPSCYSQNYPLNNGTLANGDITQCIQILEAQPDLSLVQQFSDAQAILKQEQTLHWITLGAIKFSISSPPFQFNDQSFNLHSVKTIADNDACHGDWGSLIQKYTDPYLYRQCLAASYFYASMVDGIGINENAMMSYPNSQQNIDWTIGALIYQETKS